MEPHLNKLKEMTNELDAIETNIPKEVKVMFYHLDYGVTNEFTRLLLNIDHFFESSKIEDCKWQDVNIRLVNEKFMRKGKGETS